MPRSATLPGCQQPDLSVVQTEPPSLLQPHPAHALPPFPGASHTSARGPAPFPPGCAAPGSGRCPGSPQREPPSVPRSSSLLGLPQASLGRAERGEDPCGPPGGLALPSFLSKGATSFSVSAAVLTIHLHRCLRGWWGKSCRAGANIPHRRGGEAAWNKKQLTGAPCPGMLGAFPPSLLPAGPP